MSDLPIEFTKPISPEFKSILTPQACQLLLKLEQNFGDKRRELLRKRKEIQKEIDAGHNPDFLAETQDIRESDWTVAPVPHDLQDRRVEITGPVDRKMVINALNSGAKAFMADIEDSHSPTWEGTIHGQINLFDAVRKTITFTNPAGKKYSLNDKIATLLVRPRGWHLEEKHALVDGKPMSASLFDFGLFFFHNAKELLKRGSGPYFYLPKLESHHEAKLWNDVFCFAQKELDLPQGTIKATVLIETILAAFEMDEILYSLKEHSAGLNCGRWDYIFSFIKKFRNRPDYVLPDRSLVTMTREFMKNYSELTIHTCHRRNAHAMGGMAAQIPIKNDPAANEVALKKVAEDKEREAKAGHDGTWVAHPGLIPIAMEVFDTHMPEANQVSNKREDVRIQAQDLLKVPEGKITEGGLRTNISVGVQYLEAWLRGLGCVPLYNLMEDAATAEISRAQIWQWIRHPKGVLEDGSKVTTEKFKTLLSEELEKIKSEIGADVFAKGKFSLAAQIFEQITIEDDFAEFLTLKAYEHLD